MDELQLQNKPKARYLGPTSVKVPPETRRFLNQNGMTLAGLIRVAPDWRENVTKFSEELFELRENMKIAQKKLAQLYEENEELRKFKTRTVERLNKEGVPK
jgi:hypothetical protein